MNTALAAKIPPHFLATLKSDPDASVCAIVRCERLSPDFLTAAVAAGLTVSRQLRLIRGLAVAGSARNLLELANAPWVLRIEPDQPIHTMR